MEITFWGAEAGIFREESKESKKIGVGLNFPEKQKHYFKSFLVDTTPSSTLTQQTHTLTALAFNPKEKKNYKALDALMGIGKKKL